MLKPSAPLQPQMTNERQVSATPSNGISPGIRRLILLVVAAIGLAAIMWFAQEVGSRDDQQLQQRFQIAATGRGDAMVSALTAPLSELLVLQRLFHGVGAVDWPLFQYLVDPIIGYKGTRCIGWAPLVKAGQRIDFESHTRQLWQSDFSIKDISQGKAVPAAYRRHYLPVLYRVARDVNPPLLGLDISASEESRVLVEQAVNSNEMMAFDGAVPPLLAGESNALSLSFLLPVYHKPDAPIDRAERSSKLRGMLFMGLDMGEVLDIVRRDAAERGLRTELLVGAQVSAAPRPGDGDAAPTYLTYSRDFVLAGRPLTLRVVAEPEWIKANSATRVPYILAVGLLLTVLLLVALSKWLSRHQPAPLRAYGIDAMPGPIAERWVSKLSRVVEQNPASIALTDLDGVIEYVNDKFLETTGYTREDALGQNIRKVRPEILTNPNYQEVVQALAAGQSWMGELQSKQRDGTCRWERLHVSPIRNVDGVITNHVSTREDISELRAIMAQLTDSEERFRSAVSVMVEGLIILTAEGRFVFANRAAEAFLGVGASELAGRSPAEVITFERLRADGSDCPFEEYPSTIALREGREVRDFVMGYRAADGIVRWVEINALPLRSSAGAINGVVLTFAEITALQSTEEQLKLAFEAIRCSGEGILVTDAENRILSVNPAYESVTGYRADAVLGKTPAIFASPRHDERFFAAMRTALNDTGYWRGEVWNQRSSGELFPEWLGISVVRDDRGQPKYHIYIFSDMTERKAAQQRIEFLAHHDPLTTLPNRLLLRDRVEQAKMLASRAGSRFALMFLDLDRFKTINDSLGHPVGDSLLLEVVERLKTCVRESDTIARQGGDEFIILLNDVRDSESVARIADKIHQRMAEPFMLGGHALNTSFSIGITLYPDDGADFDSLLQKADTAMYHAKESGRNAHRFFTEQMNLQVVEHLTLETQLRKAIDNKEFVLHYQPQMDLREGTIIGVEALIRWNSPENGLVSPARFIPVAEVSGLIVPIGAWVIHEACHQARAWQESGLPPFVVAVNLSAVQFKRLDLINTVINALVLSELDSQWLELELTESILLQDTESTLDVVRRLKALGVKLSVDDFGTGYSSLAYLKRFSVDKLKIDQSFIRDLVSDPDDAAIVRAIIQMAHSLKLKTIAEGVETEELTNLLRIFNCDEIQGYGFARPMPADQLEAFVRQHQTRAVVEGV